MTLKPQRFQLRPPDRCTLGCLLAAVVGLTLLVQSAQSSSATYDEVTYIELAARWWRGQSDDAITRMGSPLTFWKIQQAPVLWWLDHSGRSHWIDDPIENQSQLLPVLRIGTLWIWLVTMALVTVWSKQLYGSVAMLLAAWVFALGPNLIAHAPLLTMEMPVTAAMTAAFWAFWHYKAKQNWQWLAASAALAGLAFSCKFTAVLVPVLIGIPWLLKRPASQDTRRFHRILILIYIIFYILIMLLTNLALTGFATIPLSEQVGVHPTVDRWFGPRVGGWLAHLIESPLPQDWVGFITQLRHQRSGGPSYLLGERAQHGWWYYYLVASALKVPLGVFALLVARAALALIRRKEPRNTRDALLWIIPVLFLLIASIGSKRNYGFRYLLPVAPLLIVWFSALAAGPRWARGVAFAALLLLVAATLVAHPHEITFFNALAGQSRGRGLLADSNLDWGQGARALARLQNARPELRELTLYYFGSTSPVHYGVQGRLHVIDAGELQPNLPTELGCDTAYLGVSVSLRWGPWGPPHFFDALKSETPATFTDDGTIAIYRTPLSLKTSTHE